MSDAFYEPCEKHGARRCAMCAALERQKSAPSKITEGDFNRGGADLPSGVMTVAPTFLDTPLDKPPDTSKYPEGSRADRVMVASNKFAAACDTQMKAQEKVAKLRQEITRAQDSLKCADQDREKARQELTEVIASVPVITAEAVS